MKRICERLGFKITPGFEASDDGSSDKRPNEFGKECMLRKKEIGKKKKRTQWFRDWTNPIVSDQRPGGFTVTVTLCVEESWPSLATACSTYVPGTVKLTFDEIV